MTSPTKTGIIALSIVCLLGSVFGMIVHFLFAQNWAEWMEATIPEKSEKLRKVVTTTIYLQMPQHLLELFSVVFLIYGLIKSKKQFLLPWLVVNAIGIGLYSTILLVVGMILSIYLFFGYILIAFYGFLWYCVQWYYTNLAENGNSDIIYTIME